MSYTVSVSNKSEYITFNSKSADLKARYLSNFADCEIKITFPTNEVLSFPTGEHAFQASKFYINGHHEYARTFTDRTMSALDAKKNGKKLKLSQNELQIWANSVKQLQYYICWFKVQNTPGLKEYLIETRGRYLLHLEALGKWSEYGGVFLEKSQFNDGRLWLKGNNLLGQVWMQLRDTL